MREQRRNIASGECQCLINLKSWKLRVYFAHPMHENIVILMTIGHFLIAVSMETLKTNISEGFVALNPKRSSNV